MKVGIISRRNYRNFGNILQQTALSEAVKSLGYDPVIADYTYHGWLGPYQPMRSLLYSLRRRLQSKLSPKSKPSLKELHGEERRERFTRFYAEHTAASRPLFNAADLMSFSEECDAFISGSDQVWAPMWYDPHYFLDFCPEHAKKISYAASFGRDHIDSPALEARMARDIAHFAHISVREKSGVELVRRLTGRDASWTLDPTLLLDASHYQRFERPDFGPEAPYLLCYFLGGRPKNWQRAANIARARGLKLVVVPYLVSDLDKGDYNYPEIGPEEFLALFHRASFVCTDSFHGTVFSLLYRVPFIAFERNEKRSERMSTRITDLLSLAGLEERFIPGDGLKDAVLNGPIDFDGALERIAAAREASLTFLRDALASACAAPRTAPWQVAGDCCGCGACAAVCPKGAISIERDAQGFRRAVVDDARCVRCGKCRSVCPFTAPKPAALMDMRGLYAFKAGTEVLECSSSGGFSHVLGEYLAGQGYPMIGYAYDRENRRAVHRVAGSGDSALREAFCGSKYIQSDLAEALEAVRGGLDKALFVGTPCQVAAVARMLGERRGDWVLAELICHGTPSDALFEKYLDDLDGRFHVGRTPAVLFRDKSQGWKPSRMTVRGEGGSYGAANPEDPFLRLFLMDLTLRDSCFECPYRRGGAGDLRIGDYWGPRYKGDNTGVSMVAALTERGEALVQALAALPGISCQQHPTQDYVDGQPAYNNPRIPTERDAVLAALNDPAVSMAEIRHRWIKPRDRDKWIRRTRAKAKRILKRLLRRGKA